VLLVFLSSLRGDSMYTFVPRETQAGNPGTLRAGAGDPVYDGFLARRDVLVFQSPPLAADLEIAGPVSVDLWISSSAPDTDFTAKLVDVAPPNRDHPWGYAMNLADRIIRVSSGDYATARTLLKPGEIRKVTIDLVGVANRFRTGHRIRVDISSSNFPFFDVNPNTGERPGYQTHETTALNTVYHDRERPSHVNLPVMPAAPVH